MPPRDTTTTPSPGLPALSRGMIVRVNAQLPARASEADQRALATTALTFQYNPDLITRTRAGRWETRARRNRGIGTPQDVRAADGSGSAHLLAESETISLKVMFDATEDILNGAGRDGVLPELAFLENASMGRAQSRDLQTGESTRTVRPDELLVVLGPKRAFPAVLTNLTIVEQKFAPDLTPIRAEVDLKFNVLEPVDVVFNVWINTAFEEVVRKRTSLSAAVETASTIGEVLDLVLSSGTATAPAAPAEGGET